eukprot:COSAG02_NODE_2450_length_8834_cov_8.817401_5_plen_320_part_01
MWMRARRCGAAGAGRSHCMARAGLALALVVATVHAQELPQPLDLSAASITFSSVHNDGFNENNLASLLDGDPATQWHSGEGTPAWLAIDLGSDGAAFVSQYSIQNRASGFYVQDSPTSVALEGSNDETTWTALQSEPDTSWAYASETKSFDVPDSNIASYRYYRLYFTEAGTRDNGERWVVLGALSLLGYDTAPSGVSRLAKCTTITCANGWEADPAAAQTLCAHETCDASTADNDLCCDTAAGCAGVDCGTGATCADVTAPGTGYTCACGDGYVGDTTDAPCVDTDGCAGVDCGTGATCADVTAPGTGYTCACGDGYVG